MPVFTTDIAKTQTAGHRYDWLSVYRTIKEQSCKYHQKEDETQKRMYNFVPLMKKGVYHE